MTNGEASAIVAMVRLWWPHSNLGPHPQEVVTSWRQALDGLPVKAVEAALRHLRDSGREHAPAVGVVASEVRAGQQGEPPSFDDMQALLSRNIRCFPYRPEGQSVEDTAEAIEALGRRGVHEAVLRFVAEHGAYAVRNMPDPSRYVLDPNASADRRDMVRRYHGVTLPAWRADPTPGLALSKARRAILAPANGLRRLSPTSDPLGLYEPAEEPEIAPEDIAAMIAETKQQMTMERLRREREAADRLELVRKREEETARVAAELQAKAGDRS